MAEYSQKWHNGTSRGRSTKTFDGLAAIQAQLNNLGREIKKVNEKVYAAQDSTPLYKARQTSVLFLSHLDNHYCEEEGNYRPKFMEACGASHINNVIPWKEKDPGSFTLPYFINDLCFDNALVDLGASISVMSLLTYLNLGLGELVHNRLTVELADRTVKYPKGIAENVLVGIGKFTFPIDFIILDIPEDIKVPLILGRPFLSTARAKIDVYKRKITLRDYKSFKAQSDPVLKDLQLVSEPLKGTLHKIEHRSKLFIPPQIIMSQTTNDNFSLHDEDELSLHDDASLDGSVPATNKEMLITKTPTNNYHYHKYSSYIKLPGPPKKMIRIRGDEIGTFIVIIANEVWKVIQKELKEASHQRFQKLLSQLDALGAGMSDEDANHKFLRSLPPAWDSPSQTSKRHHLLPLHLISQVVEPTQKPANADDVDLIHEDLDQIDDLDLEEMDINWGRNAYDYHKD
ncbi:retrovirus-related pol polyprotein from transposon TNT 1-94 [Tanacetum coccineum]|uniref:Retrovirus-related pol polyprotein from transposon TNT 1-94 n=1 Tax=Tanacetum coccineum TaxID=301880 RepID=A0ABQ5INE6_9ASTR